MLTILFMLSPTTSDTLHTASPTPMDYVLHVYVAAVLVVDLFACLCHRHGQMSFTVAHCVGVYFPSVS